MVSTVPTGEPGITLDFPVERDVGNYGAHHIYRYHSHVDLQIMTAQGPIIVVPKDNSSCPVEYDEEIIMQMQDYYHV